MIHRHLAYHAATPLADRGLAALDDALRSGDLEVWEPLLRAVAADPHGDLADRLLWLLGHDPPYGTGRLLRTWIARRRGRVPAATATLAGLRHGRGLTQRQVAAQLGATQPDVSKLEARRDLRVSTLRAYVTATGGQLRLVAAYPEGDLAVRLPDGP